MRTATLILTCVLSFILAGSPSGGAETDTVRQYRLSLLSDPHRPAYHFVVPEGSCMPFDPNGAIFWKGRYHLCYIYQGGNNIGCCWGHASSTDLVHWRHHPPALIPSPSPPPTPGIDPRKHVFSGNCFINKKGQATILFHAESSGNCIAVSDEKNLDNWTKLPSNPVVPTPPAEAPYQAWDPHGWLEGDTYYAIFGQHPAPVFIGDPATLFKADTIDKWEYVGPLLSHDMPDVAADEDLSCPDLFKLGDKHMLLCISHKRGCRYYLGRWENEQFHPEIHRRMSWVDNSFISPESLIDDRGRRIMWAWIADLPGIKCRTTRGWSGTMSLPRLLALGEDGTLRIRPVKELEALRYNAQKLAPRAVKADSEVPLKSISGNCIELQTEIIPGHAKQFGVKVCCSPGGEEQTLIYYDTDDKKLKIDTRKSSLGDGPKSIEAGPLQLQPGEPLKLRIFVDKSVIEVFANDRQAVTRRIYPTRKDSVGVALFSKGGDAEVSALEAWDMMPSNPY